MDTDQSRTIRVHPLHPRHLRSICSRYSKIARPDFIFSIPPGDFKMRAVFAINQVSGIFLCQPQIQW
jgi:hypothetical protein